MLDTTYTRTTITIPEEILWAIKKKALAERKDIKDVITEGLSLYLGAAIPVKDKTDIASLFGSWKKGEKGINFLKRTRYARKEKEREKYLQKLWKKS